MKPYILKRSQSFSADSRYIVWLPDNDEIGVLAGAAIETSSGHRAPPASIVILSDEQSYVKWVLFGRGGYLSPGEYAWKFKVSKWTVSRYARSNLGRALGALNGFLPDNIVPDVWLPIFLSRRRAAAKRKDEIVSYVNRYGAQQLHHLAYHFSGEVGRPAVRKTISALVREGRLRKSGFGRGAILSIPPKKGLDKIAD